MQMQIKNKPMIEAIFRAVFDENSFPGVSASTRLDAIRDAGRVSQEINLCDTGGSIEFSVSFDPVSSQG